MNEMLKTEKSESGCVLVYYSLNWFSFRERERERGEKERLLHNIVILHIFQLLYMYMHVSYDDNCDQRINLYQNENSNLLLKLFISKLTVNKNQIELNLFRMYIVCQNIQFIFRFSF